VTPSTVIAELILENPNTAEGQTNEPLVIPLRACVWGTILEINQGLTPKVIMEDPLLDGYLAVILPSGRFPPNEVVSASSPHESGNDSKRHRSDKAE